MKTVMINQPGHASDYHATIYAPLDWQAAGLQKTATGYGKKIPTTYMINYQGKKRRIYVDQFSNVWHTYIIVDGEKVTVC